MTSLFLALPLELRDLAGMASVDHWKIYLPALLLAVATMVPFVVLAEKRGRMKGVFLFAIALLTFALGGLYAPGASVWGILAWVYVFFVGFNILEATLPSLVSKFAPATGKGTAMGVYGTAQFAGAFLGGVGGGLAHQQLGPEGVFAFGVVVGVIWLAVASGMRSPRHLSNELLSVGPVDRDGAAALTARLLAVPGVAEAVVVTEEGVAYLKVDRAVLDRRALDAFCPADA